MHRSMHLEKDGQSSCRDHNRSITNARVQMFGSCLDEIQIIKDLDSCYIL